MLEALPQLKFVLGILHLSSACVELFFQITFGSNPNSADGVISQLEVFFHMQWESRLF